MHRISGSAYVDVKNGDVYLLNGTRVGTTGIWVPLNLLYTGSKIALPRSMGYRAGGAILVYSPSYYQSLERYALKRLGKMVSYGPVYKLRSDPTDEEAYYVRILEFKKFYELVKRGITNGTLGEANKTVIGVTRLEAAGESFRATMWRAINITRKDGRLEFILVIEWVSLTGARLKEYIGINGPEGYAYTRILKTGYGPPIGVYHAVTGIAVRCHFYSEPLLIPLGIERLIGSGLLDPTGSRLPKVTGFETAFYGYGGLAGAVLMAPMTIKLLIASLNEFDKFLRKKARGAVRFLESLRYPYPSEQHG